MKDLLSFPSFRKVTAALVAVLRVIQSPFTFVVWHLEAAVSVLEIALEFANLNREDAR